jgi:hypothetical protein
MAMDLNAARQRYGELHAAWAEAHVEATEARAVCTAQFRAGVGPSIADLDRAELLEAREEDLRNAMDEFVGSYFGD